MILDSTANTKKVIQGINDAGNRGDIGMDTNNHLEVAIHSPRLPFGSIHTENLEPEFQVDAVYDINPGQMIKTTGINVPGTTSATITGSNNLFKCSTGTTAYSFSSLQTRERLRYRPGQGAVARFTALFSEPAAKYL